MDKFSELKAAAMAATPGPWILDDDSWSEGDNANVSTEERYDGRIVSIAQIEGGGSESGFDEPFSAEQQANARYITAANPAVVLALLAERDSNQQNYQNAMEELRIERAQRQAADQLIAELEADELALIDERDSAEDVIAEMYEAATGNRPQWSSCFRFSDAVEGVAQVRAELEAKLATPVQLPGFYKDADGNVWLNPVQVVKEIRRSGFTVEGDE